MSLRLVLIAAALIASGLYFTLRVDQTRARPLVVTGFVEADSARVGSRVGGRVAAVHVDEGARVAAGDLLLELEPYDLLERRAAAAASLAAARAELARLERGSRPEEVAQAEARRDRAAATLDKLVAGPRPPEIAAAAADVALAEAEVEFRTLEARRAKELKASNFESQRQLDRAEFDLRAAEATREAKRAALELLRLGTRDEEIREARAALAEAAAAWRLAEAGFRIEEVDRARAEVGAEEAALAAIDRAVEELAVKAPIAGVVEAIDLEPGDLIAANAPVLSLLDERSLHVRTYVPEDRLDLDVGDTLPVVVDALPNETITGTIRFVAREAEFTPGNVQTPKDRSQLVFRVKLSLPAEARDRLRAGMAATVTLPERK